MTKPYSIETILSELGEDADAWVLQDKTTSLYVTIPHPNYPGKNPIHFFLSKEDAQSVFIEIADVNPKLKNREIYPVKVKLVQALKGVEAGADNPWNADGFVVHSPNEVYEFVRDNEI